MRGHRRSMVSRCDVGGRWMRVRTDGGRTSRPPVRRRRRPSVDEQAPPAMQLRPVSHVRSSGTPSSVTDWTYWRGPSGSGSTKSGRLDREAFRRRRRSSTGRTTGALTKKRLWPATGNSPSDAHTYQELSPPESSLPGSPPRPVPNWLVHDGVDDLGGAVGPAGVVVRPGHLHVGLVVEALEPVERVARRHLLDCRARRPGCFTGRRRTRRTGRACSTKASSPPASSIRAAMSCSSRNE